MAQNTCVTTYSAQEQRTRSKHPPPNTLAPQLIPILRVTLASLAIQAPPATKAADIKKPLTLLAALSVPFFHSVTSRYNSSVRTFLVIPLSSYYRSYPLSLCSTRSRPLVSLSSSIRNTNILSTSFNSIKVTIPV